MKTRAPARPRNSPDRTRRLIVNVVLAIAAVVFLYPIAQMVVDSFKSNTEIMSNPGGLPIQWTLSSYADVVSPERSLLRDLVNSIVIAGASTACAVLFSAAAAYAFAKLSFPGRNALFAALLMTMMVPPEVVVPGQFILFARVGWINTLQAQILPEVTPILGLFLIRQYMVTIPDELLEAARLDGAGQLTIFLRIILPVSSPVLSAYAILHFLHVWNAYLWPTLVATDDAVKPIMVALPELVDPLIGFLPIYGTIMAGCVLATLPLAVVFFIFQDKFMSSVTIGAVK
ncbi:MAG TPA: carbohydrate ABC transporter permease [Stellaceae bacterium]|nr:carbohydrate ABC transporter permease [Stellaceae bacterium]